MDLIDGDVGDSIEEGLAGRVAKVALEPAEEESSRAEEDAAVRARRLALEPDLVSDGIPDVLATLLGDTLGDTNGGDSARLGANDVALGAVPAHDPVVEDELRKLGRLSGAGSGEDNDDG